VDGDADVGDADGQADEGGEILGLHESDELDEGEEAEVAIAVVVAMDAEDGNGERQADGDEVMAMDEREEEEGGGDWWSPECAATRQTDLMERRGTVRIGWMDSGDTK
jgi:hypothetical protein